MALPLSDDIHDMFGAFSVPGSLTAPTAGATPLDVEVIISQVSPESPDGLQSQAVGPYLTAAFLSAVVGEQIAPGSSLELDTGELYTVDGPLGSDGFTTSVAIREIIE